MDKLRQFIATIASIKVEIKQNNRFVNPMLAYLLVLLGAVHLVKLLN